MTEFAEAPGLGRPRATRLLGRETRRSLPPARLLVPALVLVGVALLPLAYLVIRAIGVDPSGVALLARPRTVSVLMGTLVLTLVVAAGSAIIGAPLAWLTTRTDLPFRRAWAVLVIVPIAIPSYVMAFAVVSAFGPRGALQGLLEPFGVGGVPSLYGLPGAAIVLILSTYPYVLLATRAGLARSDRRLEEAARSLGDTPAAFFRRVTMPLLVPAVTAGVLLTALYTLSDFGAVAILRFDSLARAVYLQYQSSFDRQLAALLGLVLVSVAMLVTLGESALHRPVGRASQGPPSAPVRLGRWRWPALAFCGVIVLLALVLPAATVLWWLVRGVANGEPIVVLLDATLNSFAAGAAAAVLAGVLALPVALLVVRRRGALARFVETGVSVPYAMPGIALGLAVVFLAANLAPLLYQTLLLLVVVYAMRFLPEALAPTRVSLGLLSERLPEAARSLGRGTLGVLWSVTLPALRPGLLAGGALVFLTTVKELPITLLLSPIGFDTLATSIWGAASEGFYARAAGPAVLLVAMSTLSVALLVRRGERS